MPMNAYTSRVLAPLNLSSQQRARWESFSAQNPLLASPYLSLHYSIAMAQAGMDARVAVLFSGEEIVGFLPYQFSSPAMRALGAAERIGGELCDSFGLIAAPGVRIDPATLLRLAQINYLSFSHLEQPQIDLGLSGEQPRTGLRVAVAEAEQAPGGDPLAAVASVTPALLAQAAANAAEVERQLGPLHFSFDHPDRRAQRLDEVIALKRQQYQREGGADMLAASVKQRALQLLGSCQADSCRTIISTLHAGETWLASHFGIMGHGMLVWWFPVHNPDFARFAPADMLMHATIRAAGAHGVTVFDKGEGDTPAKRVLHSEAYPLYRGVWRNGSLSGVLADGVQRVRWRLGY